MNTGITSILLMELTEELKMTDFLQYSLPMGYFGELVNMLIVSHRLEEVFNYRKKRVEEILGHI